MNTREQIEHGYKEKIVGILTVLFPHAKIYLFGSRARGTALPFSDVDIALDEGKTINRLRMGEAIAMLNESNIPYKIEIVDIYEMSETMVEQVKKDGIVWKT